MKRIFDVARETIERSVELVTGTTRPWLILAVLALAAASPGCGVLDPRPDTSRYFVLASLRDLGGAVETCALPKDAVVGLGPVRIPEYLREQALLTRTSPTELTRSTSDRWSEPLESMLPRVLADDLSQILDNRRIRSFPWYSSERPDWQIEVDLVRFEPDREGEISLVASWRVRELGGTRSAADEFRVTRRAESADPAQRAQALSAALGALAEELARSTCKLAAAK
jgi:uncharacterized lipoprotein YmbA